MLSGGQTIIWPFAPDSCGNKHQILLLKILQIYETEIWKRFRVVEDKSATSESINKGSTQNFVYFWKNAYIFSMECKFNEKIYTHD